MHRDLKRFVLLFSAAERTGKDRLIQRVYYRISRDGWDLCFLLMIVEIIVFAWYVFPLRGW